MNDKLKNPYTGWKETPDPELVQNSLLFLQSSHNEWTLEQHKKYQWEQIKNTVRRAYFYTDHYREMFDSSGITPADIRSLDDFRRLPLVDKETIKADYDRFLAKDVDRSTLKICTSGGSTGDPLSVYFDNTFHALDRAITYFYLWLTDHNPDVAISVRMHGDPIPEEAVRKGIYSYFIGDNKLVLSSQHVGIETCKVYVEQINRLRPHYIHAYPSALAALCFAMREAKLSLKVKLNCVYCDSETLYPGQKQLIESVLNCPVYQAYAHTEGAVYGVSLPHCSNIHILTQSGYTEILKEDGCPATIPGESGEIVVTGFYNKVFPLIRYRTFDVGVIGDSCCNKHYLPLKEIKGRVQDFAVSVSGNSVPIGPGLFDYHINWSGVSRFQIVQEKRGELNVYLLLETNIENSFSSIAKRLQTDLNIVFGSQFSFHIFQTDEIDFTGRGKYRYFMQKLQNA